MKHMSIDFSDSIIKKIMLEGNFGLEKESLRVTEGGFLSHTRHPFGEDPHMERDFCENQTELITDVTGSVEEAWEQLAFLHKKAVRILLNLKTGPEYLWPFSNPPYVRGEDDIPIAAYQESLKGKELYREYLAGKYGKKKMLFSGIHFNFSFSDPFLEAAYRKSGMADRREYTDRIYLELAKKVTRYSWLIVYLTAASPVMDGSYFSDQDMGKDILKKYASPRCSEIGYWNNFVPLLDYKNLTTYVESIEKYIEEGKLREAAELYYPVRLKPSGVNSLERLKRLGVNHIELRMLDLNPLAPIGVRKEDLQFLHLFLLYLMSLEDRDFCCFEQMMAIKNEKRAARYEQREIWIETGWNQAVNVQDAALDLLFGMERFLEDMGRTDLLEPVYYQERKVQFQKERYAVKVKQQFQREYVKKGMAAAKEYSEKLVEENDRTIMGG